MKLSIVVPAFNVRDSIGNTLTSLARLNPQPHEVLVVDDGSTDGTTEIIDSFVSSYRGTGNFRSMRQENQGVSVARNVGLDNTTGDYLLFLDGDDTVSTDLVSHLAREDVEGAQIIYWKFKHMRLEAEGRSLSHHWRSTPPESTGTAVLRRVLIDNTERVHLIACAFHREFLASESLRFTPGCAAAQDVEFLWKALGGADSVRFVDAELSTWEWRKDSVTNVMNVSRLDGVLAHHRAAGSLSHLTDPDGKRVARVVQALVVPRFMDYFQIIARDRRCGTATETLAAIEARNPGLMMLIRQLIRQRQAQGESLPRRWVLFRHSPKALVWHLRLSTLVSHRRKRG